MSLYTRFSVFGGLAALLSVLAIWLNLAPSREVVAEPAKTESFSPYVDAQGNISLPDDYRTEFLHLGTFALETELHGVYARSEDVQAYLHSGKFPDGAVIVKDVYEVETEILTTGTSSYATKTKVWFVMIKDAKGRFKGHDLWGDGWGWALFEAQDPGEQIATDYRTDCRACHVPARGNDWLYVRGYPVLRKEPNDW